MFIYIVFENTIQSKKISFNELCSFSKRKKIEFKKTINRNFVVTYHANDKNEIIIVTSKKLEKEDALDIILEIKDIEYVEELETKNKKYSLVQLKDSGLKAVVDNDGNMMRLSRAIDNKNVNGKIQKVLLTNIQFDKAKKIHLDNIGEYSLLMEVRKNESK